MKAELGLGGQKCWDREWIKGRGTLRTPRAPQGLDTGFLEAPGLVLRVASASHHSCLFKWAQAHPTQL